MIIILYVISMRFAYLSGIFSSFHSLHYSSSQNKKNLLENIMQIPIE